MAADPCLAVDAGEFADRTFRPIAFGGHCFYVRRCVVGEKFGDDFRDRMIKGIVLPQTVANKKGGFTIQKDIWDRSQIAEVIAKGPRVGTPCSKDHMHRYKRARFLEDSVSIGDLLLFDNSNFNPGILESPFASFEKFVEESVPIAIYRTGD